MKPNNNSAFKHMSQKNLPFVSKYNCSSSLEVISVGVGAFVEAGWGGGIKM